MEEEGAVGKEGLTVLPAVGAEEPPPEGHGGAGAAAIGRTGAMVRGLGGWG